MSQELPLREVIPESLKAGTVAHEYQTSVVNRKRVQVFASGGSTFNAGQSVNFTLSSAADSLNGPSAIFRCTLSNTSTGTNANTVAWDDLYTAIINSAKLSIGGVSVESIEDLNKVVNMLVYSHVNPEKYNRDLSISLGAWKWNNNGFDTVGDAGNVNVFRLDSLGVIDRQATVAGIFATGKSVEVAIPLSLIFNTFKIHMIPLGFLPDIKITLNLETAVKALVGSTAADITPGYQISNPRIVFDALTMSQNYMEFMERNLMQGAGYSLPIPTLTSTVSNVATAGLNDVQNSHASPFLKSIYYRLANSGDDTSITKYSISGQANTLSTDTKMRLSIGTKTFPEYGELETVHEIMEHNKVGLAHMSNMADQMGLQDVNTYNAKATDNSTFYALFNLEKVHNQGADSYIWDSYDSSNGGSVIKLRANFSGATQVLTVYEDVKVLSLKGGVLRVE